MGISPPTRQQTEINVCAACRTMWRDCKCNPDLRTESLESLLANEDLFPDASRRHTCVFLYHSYQRWSPKHGQGTDEFTLACLPLWEGWYAAWLKPEIDFPEDVTWSEYPVVKCTVRYCNGTYLEGFIESDGNLLLNIPGVRPPRGKDYDEDRGLVRTTVGVSQSLTIQEILAASRGLVYGGRSQPNSWRRVSHVVREEDDTCLVRLLDEKEGVPGKELRIETERVKQYVPHMLDEIKWRGRRRFRRAMAREVQKYLYAFVERARLNDDAVRFALRRGWLEGLPSPRTLIKDAAEEMAALSNGAATNGGPPNEEVPSSENGATRT